jgi:formylglycine-generating enzyme required for sulfatase activity
MDFGLARAVDGSGGTRTGTLKGTLDYMAPERFGNVTTASADVYALGLVAWELLAGRRAVPPGDLAAKMGWHRNDGVPDVRTARADCPPWLASLLSELTSREVTARPADGSAALARLRALRGVSTRSAGAPAPRPVMPGTVEVRLASGLPAGVPSRNIAAVRGGAAAPRPNMPGTVVVPLPATAPAQPWIYRREGRANGGPVQLQLARLSAGEFIMGSPPTESGRSNHEAQHRVSLTRGIEVCVVPVTQALYAAVLGEDPSAFKGPERPVERVSWYDSIRFCNAASAAFGLPAAYWIRWRAEPSVTWDQHSVGFRLPTEAEWEYAARVGTGHVYAGGDEPSAVAWVKANSNNETSPVGQKRSNAAGLFDMSGNVWEWCWDWYGGYPARVCSDPTGPASGSSRLIRGGSWYNDSLFARVAYRGKFAPSDHGSSVGLRLFRTAP